MEKERLYEVTVDEQCDARFSGGSCKIVTVTVNSKSANEAIKKALEIAKNELVDLSDSLFVSMVKCVGQLTL